MIELQDFIVESLRQIVEGVMKAREEIKESGATIPSRIFGSGELTAQVADKGIRAVSRVEFDATVGISTERGTDGRLKIAVLSASIGGGASANKSDYETTHVKFTIPLTMPILK